MGPQFVPHTRGMRNRLPGNGRHESVPVEDSGGCRRPQPYCFVAPREPLRYPQAPTIMVPTELRCSHSWPSGVDPESSVKNVMPKLDSAASEHVVWIDKFLDNYELLPDALTASWGCSDNNARAIGKGTLVLSTWLPDGSRSMFVLHDVLHIPALRVNLLSVPKMLADADGK